MGDYDVIIVGARCAGAASAAFLARSGARVLLLDANQLPSDHVLSTHYVHGPGMDVLEELGVGARVRAEAPITTSFMMVTDDERALVRQPKGREGYCIRRFKVDAWVQEAATRAGAELRDRSRVVELVKKGNRVAGVVVETLGGRETILADLVVGADGASSTVAKLAGVEEYLGFDMTRGAYWSYWPRPACWNDKQRYPYDALFAYHGDDLRYVFQTDDDLLLLVAVPPNAVARGWGGAHREKLADFMRSYPATAPLVENNAPVGKTAGYVSGRFFYRRPVGPGFALVGDAGTYKDFVTGHGMTDAFLGAKRLAAAIVDGRDAAFVHYWRERDALTLPLFFDARRLGEVGFNDPLTRVIVRHMGESGEITRRMALAFDRKLSPFDVVSPMQIAGWVVREALRGRFDSIGPFLKVGKTLGEYQKEIQRRQALVDEARATLAAAPKPAGTIARFAARHPAPAN